MITNTIAVGTANFKEEISRGWGDGTTGQAFVLHAANLDFPVTFVWSPEHCPE